MTGIYTYARETNYVSNVNSVAVVLYLQFVLHVMLLRQCNMFCTVTLTVPAVCVQCPLWLFLYFLNFVLYWSVAQVLSE